MVQWWWLIIVAVIVAVATFFITRFIFQKQLEKNPPIDEKTIRFMYQQMGRKPSERDIMAIMNRINKNVKNRK